MTYSSGTITSATPASALLAAFDTAILAVAGWSKVTSLLVVGTNTWSVYKSAAASNSFGSDFYVAFGYVTATGTILHTTIFEQWNSTTNVATNFPPNSAQIPTATTWANPQAAASLPTTGTTIAYIDTPAFVTTGFSYGISVTADRIIYWALSSTNSVGFYMGLYDPFLPIASDPFPICLLQLGPNNAVNAVAVSTVPASLIGLCTREPLQTVSASTNFGCGATGSSAWTLNSGGSNEIYTVKPLLARVLLQGRQSGAYRGLLKDCYVTAAQTQSGDTATWTLNSVPYTASRAGAGSAQAVYFNQV